MKTDRAIIRSQYVAEEVRAFKEANKKVSGKDVDRFTKKADQEVRGHEAYLNFIRKLKERLILIDDCVVNNLEIPDNDLLILEELYMLYDSDRLHWITKDVEVQDMFVQGVLFADETVASADLED